MQKERAWNSKAVLHAWRKRWADHLNAALAAAGSDTRVDHRSLETQRHEALERGDHDLAQDLDRLPQPKLGRGACALERKGIRTERGDLVRDVEEHNALARQLREIHAEIATLEAAREVADPALPSPDQPLMPPTTPPAELARSAEPSPATPPAILPAAHQAAAPSEPSPRP